MPQPRSRSAVRASARRILHVKPVTAAVAAALIAGYGHGLRSAHAGPVGEQVVGGQATVSRPDAQTTVVNQATQRAAIDWNGFSINVGEAVIFRQPSVSSVALNRVVGPDPSRIFGSLQANGQVFLINPSGILFGRGASVDVAGLVASTGNIGNADFMAGRNVFSGAAGKVTVENGAVIRAGERGYIALLGNQVSNSGSLTASNGSVALAAGRDMVLDFNGDGLLSVKVNAAAAGAKIDHSGVIVADGGRVIMTAQAKDALLDTVLNVDGIVQARGAVERNGAIWLEGGESGVTRVAGTLDASSSVPGGQGGEIRVLGEKVGLFDHARLDASGTTGGGTVLVGGDYQGGNREIANASRTYVGRDAQIDADATIDGDGGKVIVWADDATQFYGRISVRGGAVAGDGGFVETSGKHILDSKGSVDAAAPFGRGGQWLLDPFNLTISNNASAGMTAFDASANDANLLASTIVDALDLGTSVTITTGSSGSQAGSITISGTSDSGGAVDINKTAGGAAMLALQAASSIVMHAGSTIRSSSNALSVTLNADRDANGSGSITLDNATITSNGGSIQLVGGNTPGGAAASVALTSSTLSSDAGAITIRAKNPAAIGNAIGLQINGGTIQSTSGGIVIAGQGGTGSGSNLGVLITNNSKISAGAGDIKISGTAGTSGIGGQSGVVITGTSSADSTTISTTGGGNIDISGVGGTTTGASAAQGNNAGITVQNGAVIDTSAGAGSITLTGTGGAGGQDPRNFGVWLLSGANRIAADTGSIGVEGTGGSATGVRVESGTTLGSATMTGDILVRGLSGTGMTLDGGSGLLPALRTGGNVTLNASGGGSVAGTGFILANGLRLASDTAGAAFSLTNSSNNVAKLAIEAAGSSVTYRDADALDIASLTTVRELGESATPTDGIAAGSLTVTTGGDITQSARAVVTGASSFSAGANSITLTNGSNDFGGAVTLTNSGAKDIGIVDANSLTLNSASFGRSLTATAKSGDITLGAAQTFTKNTSGAGSKLRLNATNDIFVNGGAQIKSGSGVTGGVSIVFNADSDANGAGRIDLQGASGSAVTFTSNGGNITLGGRDNTLVSTTFTGVATGNATNGEGVRLSFATLDAGAGSIAIFGKGGSNAAGSNVGVLLSDATLSADGGVALTGTGGATGASANRGINTTGTSNSITSVSGDIAIRGDGASSAFFSDGVSLSKAVLTTTGTGNITITGNASAAATSNSSGIFLDRATLTSTDSSAGAGKITLTGKVPTVPSAPSGNGNRGISTQNNSTISSAVGAITLTGDGAGGGTDNTGVLLTGTSVTSSVSAAISITGTGGSGADRNTGVEISTASSVTTDGSGAIAVTGTGHGGGNGSNLGVNVLTGAKIASSATSNGGSITILGTGGDGTSGNHGISINDVLNAATPTIGSKSGNIILDGAGGNASVGISVASNGIIGNAALAGDILLRTRSGTGITLSGKILSDGAAGHDVTLNLSAGGTANQGGGSSITAGGLQLLGGATSTFSLSSSTTNHVSTLAATVTGDVSYKDSGDFAVGNIIAQGSINGPNVQSPGITATNVTLTGGAIDVTKPVTVTGAATITNSGTLTIGESTSLQPEISADGGFTQNGSGGVSLGGEIGTNGGAVTIARAVTLTDAVTIDTARTAGTNAGSVTFSSTLDGAHALTVDATATGGGSAAPVTFSGAVGASTPLSSAALSGKSIDLRDVTTDGAAGVTLTGDVMKIGGSVNAGSAGVTLRPLTAGTAIDLGSTADTTANTLELSGTELDSITAGTLVIGSNDSGAITVSNAVAPSGTSNVVLRTGAGVGESGGGTISIANLGIAAGGTVTLNDANDVSTLSISAPGQAVSYTDANDLSIGNALLGSPMGISTTPAAAETAGGGVSLIAGGAIVLSSSGAIVTSGSDSAGGAAGAGGDVLVRSTGTGDITLGAAIAAKGGNALSSGSAGAGGIVTILNDFGAISVGSIDASAGAGFGGGAAGAIQLKSSGAISQAAGSALAGGTLKAISDSSVTLSESGNTVGTLAGSSASFAFTNADSGGLTVGNLGATTSLGVTVPAANGISTAAGDITLRASAGTLAVGSGNVNAGNASALLFANDMAFTGTVTGDAGVTLAPASDFTPIVLGAIGAGKPVPLSLTGALLDQVRTTGVLTIGTSTSAAIDVGGAIAGSAGTWNTLSLVTADTIGNAAGASPTITATSLALHAANGIGSSATPLRTAVSNLAFVNTGSGGVTVDNTGALTLGNVADITTGSSAGSGALALTAHSPITIASDLIQAGDIAITAGDVAGAGDDVTLNAGVTVRSTGSSSGQGNVTLTAGDNIVLTAGSKVESRLDAFSAATSGRRVTLTAGTGGEQGTIMGSGVVLGETVVLDALTGIGSSGARAATSASSLAARTRSSGDVFVSNSGSVTLNTIDGAIANQAAGSGAYDLVANGTLTAADAVNATGTGATTLTTTGFSNIVANAPVGNANSTTTLVSAGAINGSGTVVGETVILDSNTGVGSDLARLSTAAGTLAARSRTTAFGSEGGAGGVFVQEADAFTLASSGGVDNGTANGQSYDVVAGGPITIDGPIATQGGKVALETTAGAISSTANGTITTRSTSGSGNVRITSASDIDLLAKIDTSAPHVFAFRVNPGSVTLSGPGGIAVSEIDTSGNGADSIPGGSAAGAIEFGSPASITLRGNLTARGGDGNGGFGNAGDGANLTFGAPVNLAGDVTIDTRAGSNAASAGTDGNVTFSDTVNSLAAGSGKSLTVNTSAVTTFGGAAGPSTALSSLTTDAGGSTNVSGGGVRTTGAQTYNDTFVLGADATLASTGGGDITFNSTIESTNAGPPQFGLTVNTGGTTTFAANIGPVGTLAPSFLTIGSGGRTVFAGSPGDLRVVTTDGPQTYNSPVVLAVDTNFLTCGCNPGDVTFGSSVNANAGATDRALGVSATGSIVFSGNVGDTDPLASFAVSTNATSNAVIRFNGAAPQTVNVTAPGPVSPFAAPGIQIVGPVVLAQDVSIDSGASAMSFSGAIDGGAALTTASSALTTFSGAIGASAPLAALSASGPIKLDAGAVTTSGSQSYGGAVTLGPTGNATTLTSGGGITFNGTVDGDGVNAQALTIAAARATTFNDTVGAANRLDSLAVSGSGPIAINDVASSGVSVGTTNGQSYRGPVTLSGNVFLVSDAGGAIGFSGTVDSTAAAPPSPLTITTSGPITLGGAVGASAPLDAFTTNGGGAIAVNGGAITTTNAQTYDATVTVGGASGSPVVFTGGSLAFNGAPALAAGDHPLTLTTDALTFGGSAAGTGSLLIQPTADGNAMDVGGASGVLNLATADLGRLQDGFSSITLGRAAATAATNVEAVTFSDPVTIRGLSVFVNGDITGTDNASVTLSRTPLSGGGIDLGADIRTSGQAIALNGPVTLTTNRVLLDPTCAAAAGCVTSAGANVQFASTIRADNSNTRNRALTVTAGSGTASFNGSIGVGGSGALADLDVAAVSIQLGGSTLNVNDSNAPVQTVTLNGAVTLGQNLTVNAGANGVNFGTSVDGGSGLTINSTGTTRFGGAVGATTPLASLTTNAGGITVIAGGVVTTTGDQTYNDNVTLAAGTVLRGTTPTFGGTVTGAGNDLTLDFTGTTAIDGARFTGIRNLASGSGGTTTLVGNLTTTGSQSYGDDVVLSGNTTIVAGPSDVTFAGGVDGAFALAVNSGGTTTFGGPVGGPLGPTQPLASLTTDAAGRTVINGGSVRTSGSQTYNDAVTLGADTALRVINSGDIVLASTVDGAFGLTTSAFGGGIGTRFGGAVGPQSALRTLTTNNATLAGGSITTTGDQTFDGSTTLAADTVLDAGSGNITFGFRLDGAFSLTANSTGVTTFADTGNAIAPLRSITTNAGGTTRVTAANLVTTGDQTYNDDFVVGGSALISSRAGALTFGRTLAAGGSALTLRANGIDFNGGASSVSGTSALQLQPASEDVSIGIGGAPGTLQLTAADVAALADGFSAISIGALFGGSATTTIDAVTFKDPVTITQRGVTNGTIVVAGKISGADDASITLDTGLSGTIRLGSDLATVNRPITLVGATHVGADATLSAGTGDITLGGLGGPAGITLNSAGLTTLGGAASGAPLAFLITDAPGRTRLGSMTTTGAQVYNDAVLIPFSATVNAGSAVFASTVDSGLGFGDPSDLTLNVAGTARFAGAVGGQSPLRTLTTGSSGVTRINGSIRTTLTQKYNNAVTLGGDATLTSTGDVANSDIAFAKTVDSVEGRHALTVNSQGTVRFNAAVGAAAPLESIETDAGGTTRLGANVSTAGAQTYRDDVVLSGNAALTGTDPTLGGNVIGAGFDLQLLFSSATVLDGARFTGVRNLSSGNGGTTSVTGTLKTTGSQGYDDALALLGATTLDAGAGAVTLGSTVDGPFRLTVNTTGTTTFGGAVGSAAPLASLTTNAGGTTVIAGGSVKTSGPQTYNDNVSLTANTTLTGTTPTFGGNVNGNGRDLFLDFSGTTTIDGARFSGIRDLQTGNGGTTRLVRTITTGGSQVYLDDVVLAGDAALSSGGVIWFAGNVDGASNLSTSAASNTAFFGAVGASTPLASLTTAGLTQLGGVVRTSGKQTYENDLRLFGNATLTGTTPVFGGTVAGAGNDLTLNFSGSTAIDGAKFTGINNLRTGNGGTVSLTGALRTTGTQTYDDDVTLAGATTLAGTTPAFGGTVTGAGNDLTLNFTGTTAIDGARFIGINNLTAGNRGTTTLTGALTTTGTQTYDGNVTLAGATALTGTTPTFGGALSGAGNDLTLDFSGTTDIEGSRFTGIQNLATGAASLIGALTTTGAQTYRGNVTLAGAAALNAGAGSITFAGTLESPATPRALTVTAANTRFGGVVGGNGNTLASLVASGDVRIDGGAVITSGSQTYNNAVVIGANTVLTATSGGIRFGGALDADAAAAQRTLAVDAPTGTVTFSGNVGANAAFADFDVVSGPNTIVFDGASPQTVNVGAGGDGSVSFAGNVRLDQSVEVTTAGNNVVFANAIETGAAPNRALAIDAGGGNVDLQAIGNATPLAMLTVNGNVVSFNRNAVAQQIVIGANRVLTNGVATLVSPLAFAGYDGPAALTLSGPASGGLYGAEGDKLRVDVPGLLVVTPNASRALPVVWLQGDAAKKPFYQFYDDVTRREVVYNARPPIGIDDPQQTRDILSRLDAERLDTAESASLRSADAAAAAREPDVCTAAAVRTQAALACEAPRER